MKKHYFYAMALMASLSLASCSNSDLDSAWEQGTESTAQEGQVLKLCIENGGNGITSRAGRPLFSAAAMQDVNHIDLYVVNQAGKVVLKKVISAAEWDKATDYTTGGHGKALNITFRASEKQALEDGTYTIYALGYKDTPVYTGMGFNVGTTFDAGSTTTFENMTALLDAKNEADEIFAGQVSVQVKTANKKSTMYAENGTTLNPTLVLNRQVAGVTGYFTNIPAKVGEKVPAKIRLVASNKSDKLFFTSLVQGETDGDVSKVATNVVNGAQSSKLTADANFFNSKPAYSVYEINLSDFFEFTGKSFADLDLDKDGFVGYKDAQFHVYGKAATTQDLKTWAEDVKGTKAGTTALDKFWKNPNEGKQQLVAGSVFSGEFMIPFAQVTGTNTFEIQLLDDKGVILKSWNVQVKDLATKGMAYAEGVSTETLPADAALIYNTYRNHLYTMGIKDSNGKPNPGTTDPNKPVDPTPKPQPDPDPTPTPEGGQDKPAELTNGQDLMLHVNDNWEIVHDMIID